MSRVQAKMVERFQHAAGCSYVWKQHEAMKVLDGMSFLTPDERMAVGVAMSHVCLGEGRAELDSVCKKIRERLEAAE